MTWRSNPEGALMCIGVPPMFLQSGSSNFGTCWGHMRHPQIAAYCLTGRRCETRPAVGYHHGLKLVAWFRADRVWTRGAKGHEQRRCQPVRVLGRGVENRGPWRVEAWRDEAWREDE